jgi:hypothetical protein
VKKIVLFISLILLAGCTKPELPLPDVISKDDIFSVTESSVTNGQSIHFDVPSDGVYTLTLIDKETNQVISRERFTSRAGEVVKKIYTNSIQSKYLYLLLEDSLKKEIAKTTIIIK